MGIQEGYGLDGFCYVENLVEDASKNVSFCRPPPAFKSEILLSSLPLIFINYHKCGVPQVI